MNKSAGSTVVAIILLWITLLIVLLVIVFNLPQEAEPPAPSVEPPSFLTVLTIFTFMKGVLLSSYLVLKTIRSQSNQYKRAALIMFVLFLAVASFFLFEFLPFGALLVRLATWPSLLSFGFVVGVAAIIIQAIFFFYLHLMVDTLIASKESSAFYRDRAVIAIGTLSTAVFLLLGLTGYRLSENGQNLSALYLMDFGLSYLLGSLYFYQQKLGVIGHLPEFDKKE